MPPGVAAAAESDPTIDAAHDAGRAGVPYEQFASDNKISTTSTGTNKSSSRAPRAPRKSGRPTKPTVFNPTGGRAPIGILSGAGVAGVFFGMLAYAQVLAIAEYGPTGPLLWFKAKFFNQAAGSQSSTTSTTAGATVNLA